MYKGCGPTLASEYLADKHDIDVSKETVRQWMIRSKLWHAKGPKEKVRHERQPRRSRCGDLVQWDTSEHAWLEGRGEKLYLSSFHFSRITLYWQRIRFQDHLVLDNSVIRNLSKSCATMQTLCRSM